ncbi:MAG: hypothetical protein ACK5O1_01760 [Holosporales bacterium]
MQRSAAQRSAAHNGGMNFLFVKNFFDKLSPSTPEKVRRRYIKRFEKTKNSFLIILYRLKPDEPKMDERLIRIFLLISLETVTCKGSPLEPEALENVAKILEENFEGASLKKIALIMAEALPESHHKTIVKQYLIQRYC